MKELERSLKALANKRRLSIIKYLKSDGGSSVSGIAKEIKLSIKATSKHLAILSGADIVHKEQSGLYVVYSLNPVLKSEAKHILSLL